MADNPALLDTSVVVRYLTDDPPQLGARAAAAIDRQETFVVSEVVLVECAFVLTSIYKVQRPQVVDALTALLQRRNIRLATLPKPLALEALALCRTKRYSFADAILWAQARHSGAARVLTFDRGFPAEGIEVDHLGV